MFKNIQNKNLNKGAILVYLIIVIFIFSIVMVPLLSIVMGQINYLKTSVAKEQSLQIAEAGINYYQWRLAHFKNDYQDGTGTTGPYVHEYVDRDTQEVIGSYSLTITPPTVGSTIITIQSTGWTLEYPNIKKTVTVRYGIPSLAKYSFLSNDVIWIGSNEAVNGQMQSNNGIRFDGLSNAPIQSAKTIYTCKYGQGCSPDATKPGIWGSAPQFVQNFWQFPVPAIDFSALTANLSSMKSLAQSNGIYLPPSNEKGYSLVFKSNGTIDIYKITSLRAHATGIDTNDVHHDEDIDYLARSLQFTKNMPNNGAIYIEDKVWVEGTVRGRATVAAAILPIDLPTAPNIYIPNNILYSAKDGSDVLGLISQKDVVVTYFAPNNLEIDSAMIAQNGSVQFYSYPNNIKDNITVYGSIMTFGTWTWTWTWYGNVTSGYRNTYSIYDGNLLYGPPPSFPLSSSGYQQLDWKSN
jgi:hypothetical protein